MLKKPTGWLKSSWSTTQAINARITSRAKRWKALYNAGGGTVSEYIHADFNTDCPTGLDTAPWDEQFIRIESTFKSEGFKNLSFLGKILSLRWGGWVQKNKNDVINLNSLHYSLPSFALRAPLRKLRGEKPITMADIIPHEFVHTRQHYSNHSGWIRNNDENDIDHVGINDLSKPRRIWRTAARAYYNIATGMKTKAGTISNYYAKNIEIQARLHEILAHGYSQWERLPTSKTELSAALINLGLDAPASILDELNSTEKGLKALKDFSVLPSIKDSISGTVQTFNRIHKYTGETDVQEAIWDNKYPLLYGELIEFYGDKLGRERMEMGTNPRPVIEVMYALKKHDGTMTKEHAKDLAEQVPASLATPFLNSVIVEYPKEADQFDNAMLLSKMFLIREDVKKVLFTGEQTARNYTGQFESPPLDMALERGHVPMTKILMNAGANPFQKFTMVDMRNKRLFSSRSVFCVFMILKDEKYLSDPNSIPPEGRSFYDDPESRERIAQDMKKTRAALQEMIDCSDTPDLNCELSVFEDCDDKISLSQILAKINITKGNTKKLSPMAIKMN